ncbi:hypothetical protein [Hymenobacter sp. YC55]|uniref:hypothetical protein n=1 Tax=Hymenobacter sp. YC55 TaxID=3034019 RepID=UPI0023F8CEFD|nr:hypothetical protein [Hymenobacter sp. YC55]MDF7810705.1 hypothetical protein [Hymenobacter sp. YC55]
MAVSYLTPDAPILPYAIGLDAEIQKLQLKLIERLNWLQVSYGKAYRHSEVRDSKKVYLPKVYDGGGEYRDVLPNDNVVSQSFFLSKDPISVPGSEPAIGSVPLTQSLDYIFWGNLTLIDESKPYRFEAELLREVLEVFNSQGVLVQRIYTTPEEVFRGFTVEMIKDKVLQHPYVGFRIQIDVNISNALCTVPPPSDKENLLALRRGGFLRLRS